MTFTATDPDVRIDLVQKVETTISTPHCSLTIMGDTMRPVARIPDSEDLPMQKGFSIFVSREYLAPDFDGLSSMGFGLATLPPAEKTPVIVQVKFHPILAEEGWLYYPRDLIQYLNYEVELNSKFVTLSAPDIKSISRPLGAESNTIDFRDKVPSRMLLELGKSHPDSNFVTVVRSFGNIIPKVPAGSETVLIQGLAGQSRGDKQHVIVKVSGTTPNLTYEYIALHD